MSPRKLITILLAFACLLSACEAAIDFPSDFTNDYQDRCIYYSEAENVCCGVTDVEFINVTVYIDDKATKVFFQRS